MRIAEQVMNGEVVVNMFAGVGCFSVIIARHAKNVKRVYSIDVNLRAIGFMKENIRMNGVAETVVPILGDAAEVVEKRLCHAADRVLMLLPEKALDYLPYAVLALNDRGGRIHYYGFEHAGKGEDPIEKVKRKVSDRCRGLGARFAFQFGRVVRTTGPNWHQVVLDIDVHP